MKAITKRYPGAIANNTVDFDLLSGEIHGLLGENGAGKSTLMQILAGMVQPDSGSIEIRGAPVKIRSPHDSLKMGIGMVYQHFALVPNLKVIDNIILGFEHGRVLNWKRLEIKLKQILETLELFLPLDEKLSNLSVGERQRVEIVKALFHRSEVLILDEPTSVLTPHESEELFKTIRSLRKQGKSVVLITHKIEEATRISDRISILKTGRKVAEIKGQELRGMGESERYQRVFDVMFGIGHEPKRILVEKSPEGKPVLELDHVVCLEIQGQERLKGVSFQLTSGEIFGIAGIDGNGQKELAEVIAGQRKIAFGKLTLYGNDITQVLGPAARADLGISYITDERLQEGCALSMSVAENFILRLYKSPTFSRWKILNKENINRHCKELIQEFNLKAAGPDVAVNTLSGGNIQKLLLARELCRQPAVLVCNKPTQGLDAKTTHYVRSRILQEKERGAAVLLISSDLDELLNYSDRIGVLYHGELLDIVNGCDANRENIGKLMLGMR